MWEKVKSMLEKAKAVSQTPLGSAVTSAAIWASKFSNKQTMERDLLTGKPENPNNQPIIEPRTEPTSPIPNPRPKLTN